MIISSSKYRRVESDVTISGESRLYSLVYNREKVGVRVSFYIKIRKSSGETDFMYLFGCDTSNVDIVKNFNIDKVKGSIDLEELNGVLVSRGESNVTEINTLEEFKRYEKTFKKKVKKYEDCLEELLEVGKAFENCLNSEMGLYESEVCCNGVSVRYLGGDSSWKSREEDDDYPEFRKVARGKLNRLIKQFNGSHKGFVVNFSSIGEKGWLYFSVMPKNF